jgi:hypothetical protein
VTRDAAIAAGRRVVRLETEALALESMASTDGMTPSVRLKPMAKSSKSWGVAIITA